MTKTFIYLFIITGLLSCSESYDGKLVLVEPEAGDAFNYPYYLFVPEDVPVNEKVFIMVEPNNSGFADDDLKKHLEKAKRIATKDFYMGNCVATNLNSPLVVPVFPRNKSEWRVYTHALDRDVMEQKNNTLERIDLQLISMLDDAREKLGEMHIDTREKFMMTGFSASGTFANRFTLMHPEKVFAVAAGGVNSLLILPADTLEGIELMYPVGTKDLKKIINKEFQPELFAKTPQFYFMGELDTNDAVPYDDAFDQDEREIIYNLLGKDMKIRWQKCMKIYEDKNINCTIKTFQNTGHEQPGAIKKEVLDFFSNLNPS